MKNKSLLISLLGGFISAIFSLVHLTPFPGLVFISYFSLLPLFLIGLGVGLQPLYGACLIATLIVFIFAGIFLGAEFLIFSALGPAFVVYRALLHRKKASGAVIWYPGSLLLRDLTFISAGIMLFAVGTYLYLMQDQDMGTLVNLLLNTLDPQGHIRGTEPIFVKLFPFLPGFFAFSWTVMIVVNAAMAQGLLVRLGKNLRPTPSFKDLDVPKSFLFILGLSLALSIVTEGGIGVLGKNTAFVFIFPFFIIGLGLIHKLFYKTSFPILGLTLFYFVLLVFLWPAVFVILAGILKPWVEKSITSN